MTADTPAPRVPRPRLHYAWVVALVTFVVLLVTAGIRATPGMLMVPLESEFGWSRAAISARRRHQHRAVRPDRAVRRVGRWIDGACGASSSPRWRCSPSRWRSPRRCSSQWQLTLLWGVLVGTGHRRDVDGARGRRRDAMVRRAARAGARRALGGQRDRAAGVSAAAGRRWSSAAAGAPPRSSSPGAAVVVFVVVLVFMRDRPEDLGLRPLRPAGRTPTPRPRRARSRRSRRCGWRSGRARSGSWPARSSSAARARTA